MTKVMTDQAAARRDAQMSYLLAVDRVLRAAEEARRERDRLLELVRLDLEREVASK